MPVEAMLKGYSPDDVLPSARLFNEILGFSLHGEADNYLRYPYNWDNYRGQKKYTGYYPYNGKILPPRVEIKFDRGAQSSSFIRIETDQTLESWFLYEAKRNQLGFALTELYAKKDIDGLCRYGTLLEPEVWSEILRRKYNPRNFGEKRSADSYKPRFVLCFSGEDEILVPKASIKPNGEILAKPSELPYRTVGQIDIAASVTRMASMTTLDKGAGPFKERKSHCVQRAVDHLMRLKALISSEFFDEKKV